MWFAFFHAFFFFIGAGTPEAWRLASSLKELWHEDTFEKSPSGAKGLFAAK